MRGFWSAVVSFRIIQDRFVKQRLNIASGPLMWAIGCKTRNLSINKYKCYSPQQTEIVGNLVPPRPVSVIGESFLLHLSLLTVSCLWHTGSGPILAFIICIFTFLMSLLNSKYDSLLTMADGLVQTSVTPFMIVRLSCLFTFQPVSFGIFTSCLFGSSSCGSRFFFICSL